MKTKEKKLLNGEVRISNMYETILPREEFETRSIEDQKRLMEKWREIHTNKEIQDSLGVTSAGSFANLLKKLEIPSKRTAYKKGVRQSQEVMNGWEDNWIADPIEKKMDIPIFNGLRLNYNGIYDSTKLNEIFSKLQLLLDSEENSFFGID